METSTFDSALSHTRRSDASEKREENSVQLLDVFAYGQVSSPRLYRLIVLNWPVYGLFANIFYDLNLRSIFMIFSENS